MAPREHLDRNEKEKLSDVKVIWLIGGPGAGKGTQSKKIGEKYKCSIIGGGILMRKEMSENTNKGKEIKTALEEGRKPSKEDIWDLIIKATRMALSEENDYIIFDGTPRDSSKVEQFEDDIKPCDLILKLEIDDISMETRIQQRAKIEGRIDDQDVKVVKSRIAVYHENIGLILKEMRDRNCKYVEIDAVQSIDEVFKDICNEIEKLKENYDDN